MDGAHAVEEAIAGPALACVSRRVDASGSGGEGSATRAQACGSGTPRGFRGWYCVVVEVTLHDRFEPFASSRHGIVHARVELLLDLSQLGPHALADRLASHGKSPDPVLCADMCKAQEIERLGFVFCSSFSVLFGKPSELDPARLFWMELQSKLCQSLP